MLSIILIEDESEITELVKDHFEQHLPDAILHCFAKFDEGCEAIPKIRPDIVISDWFEGEPQHPQPEGQQVWNLLWGGWFCPIVFYSVFAGNLESSGDIQADHPFVKRVPKGSGSENEVCAAVLALKPHAIAVRAVANELDATRHATVRDVAKVIFASNQSDEEKPEILRRAMRRRVAAALDDAQLCGTQEMQPWEQFLFPPISDHSMTGDIIRETEKNPNHPKAYRLILTPTCDLVKHNGRCNASKVLVAKCEEPKRFLKAGVRPHDEISEADLRKAIGTALNDSQRAGLVLLPECPTLSPLMVADLKKVELIPESDIGNSAEERKKYTRVASIDSPFREYFITWSQLQISCRPGVPPRNTSGIVDEFIRMWQS